MSDARDRRSARPQASHVDSRSIVYDPPRPHGRRGSSWRIARVQSRIATDIDFDRDGRQASYLRAPLSRNNAGWGTIEIPIVAVKNGSGPTVLLTGGIHGDEYEGQIAISRLSRELDPAAMRGRVIMIPTVNIPAALNDTRLSPIDDRDLNRCFPGNPRGTFSEMLAHFLDGIVLPLADVSVDVHTAGHSFDAALSTNMHYLPDAALAGADHGGGGARSARPSTSCSGASTRAPPSPPRSSGAASCRSAPRSAAGAG